jgi:hypothetical protein
MCFARDSIDTIIYFRYFIEKYCTCALQLPGPISMQSFGNTPYFLNFCPRRVNNGRTSMNVHFTHTSEMAIPLQIDKSMEITPFCYTSQVCEWSGPPAKISSLRGVCDCFACMLI